MAMQRILNPMLDADARQADLAVQVSGDLAEVPA
jgi:hypothetical protein